MGLDEFDVFCDDVIDCVMILYDGDLNGRICNRVRASVTGAFGGD